MRNILIILAASFLMTTPLRAATYEAPLDVRKDASVGFVAAPKAQADGAKIIISFELSAPTDVEVAVLDAQGKIIRHLAAGLLGKDAPPPLVKEALAQRIAWDKTDDAGKPAAGGPFSFRVRAGLQPQVDKYVGFDGNTFGGHIEAMTVGKDGELFVLLSDYFRGRSTMRMLDRDGKYLRTIMPYPANTPPERTQPLGTLEIDGQRLPIMLNALTGTVYPMTNGMKNQTMAWNPKGFLVLASGCGTMAEQGPPRYLLAIDPQGGAPAGVNYVGPQFRHGVTHMLGGDGEASVDFLDNLAVSPDGQFVYMTNYSDSSHYKQRHGVYRLKWSDKEAAQLFLGQDQPGSADGQFNDPEGLAVDKAGNLYVCDRGNNRVCIFSPDGKLLGKFTVKTPELIAVSQQSGEIFISSKKQITLANYRSQRMGKSTLLKFSAFAVGQGEPKEVARLEDISVAVMALDSTAQPPKLWIASRNDSSSLMAIIDRGTSLEAGSRVDNDSGLRYPVFLAGDVAHHRVLFHDSIATTSLPKILQMDLSTGKIKPFCSGLEPALDGDGNIYTLDGYGTNSISRYDPQGKPLPFAATGSNKIHTQTDRVYGPNLGGRGLCVGADGEIYFLRATNHGKAGEYGGHVDVFNADGSVKKEDLIGGAGYGDCGLGVDNAGNIYLGVNVKPADQPYPSDFMGKLPDKTWLWWKDDQRPAPWRYSYYNSYLWHWGAVMKFPASGGAFYGQHPWNLKRADYGTPTVFDKLSDAPADSVSYRSAYLGYEVKVSGALWRYGGCGIVPSSGDGLQPDPGCVCYDSILATDEYGRVFAPDVFRYCVEMLDSNGNQLARIGHYGNCDAPAAGTDSGSFVFPVFVSVNDGIIFVLDTVNRRIALIHLQPTLSADCPVP